MTQDVTIPVELEVYCTKINPAEYHKVRSVKLNGYEIGFGDLDDNLITDKEQADILDKWCMTDEETVKTIEHDIEFLCVFDDDGMLDNVALGFKPINDILSDGILKELKKKAKANHIADLKDRGIKYKGGA